MPKEPCPWCPKTQTEDVNSKGKKRDKNTTNHQPLHKLPH